MQGFVYWSEMKTCQIGLFCKSFFSGFSSALRDIYYELKTEMKWQMGEAYDGLSVFT